MRSAQIDLRCSATVETKHSADPLGAPDGVRARFGSAIRLYQPIIEPLMIPLPVIVSSELATRFRRRPFAEEDHPIEALVLDRSDKSLGVRVQIGRTVWQAHDFDAGILQESPEHQGELGISVCVQQRLACSVGVSPARVEARAL